MNRFRNILFCPLAEAGNPDALRRVCELADRNGAAVTMLGVVPEPSRLHRLLHRPELTDHVQQAERDALLTKLNRWTKRAHHPTVSTLVEVGSPALAIVAQVLRASHDLLVVTSDEDTEDIATIRRLLRKCPCPVWVIRPTRARIQRVLAAVNPDPDELDLNRTILELAASMVEQFGGELHLVHAWELYGEATMRSSAFIHTTPAELDSLLKQEKVRHAQGISDLLTAVKLRDAPWKIHLDKGSAEDVVPQVISKSRINLLIMGTLARSGIPGVLIGNTAELVLDDVKCSVIAVKPPGFVSPLA